ncbi:uncharacterized protein C8orf76 homolog [Pelodytes ibericus]
MEFPGCCFEDSVFSETRSRAAKAGEPYSAKQCSPQWFNEDLNSEDCTEIITALKFRGDLAYRHKNFEKALVQYCKCYQLLPRTNTAMRRDVQESQARCLLYLKRYKDALEVAETLKKGVLNTDQLTCALNVLIDVYSSLGNLLKAVSCLQQLISLHPFNPWMWKRLAELYMKLFLATSNCGISQDSLNESIGNEQLHLKNCGESMNVINNVDHTTLQAHNGGHELDSCEPSLLDLGRKREQLWINACASLIRARLLLQLVQPQQASFVLHSNLQAQEQIEEQLKALRVEEQAEMTEIMGEDLSSEGLREEGHVDTKSTLAITSFTMPSDIEFRDKWFKKISSILLPSYMKMSGYSR